MSVLLDALKKAAEEKKNADGSGKELSNSELEQGVESPPASDENKDVTFDLSNAESTPTDSEKREEIESTKEEGLQTKDPLSGLNLKIDNSIKSKNSDEIVPSDPNDNAHENMSEETSSLLAALDAQDGGSEVETKNDLKSEQQTPFSLEEPEAKKETKTKDDFEWSMDELPAYSDEMPAQQTVTAVDSTTPLQQNPILTKGEHTAHKTSRFSSSVSLIVTLFVVLMFIGIGFYGMLYYQEENDKLELSMKKYDLQKMEFSQPAATKVVDSADMSTENNDSKSVDEQTNSADVAQTEMPVEAQSEQKIVSTTTVEKSSESNVPDETPLANQSMPSEQVASKLASSPKGKISKQPTNNVRKKLIKKDEQKINIVTTQSKLATAYEDYRLGNDIAAIKTFSHILEKEPTHLNALLGMGAIATASNDYDTALMYYQRALESEANILHTVEAIANLSGLVALSEEWQTDLKEMAFVYPESSVLQYAVGNIYADKSDWLRAQKHYFKAYATSPENADYLVNLAISFDHLGKYDLATQYYTQALGLADNSDVNFNASNVRDRLISIRQLTVKGY